MFISLTKDDFIKEINSLVSSDNDRQALLFVPKTLCRCLVATWKITDGHRVFPVIVTIKTTTQVLFDSKITFQ